jgi:hypothetical protein
VFSQPQFFGGNGPETAAGNSGKTLDFIGQNQHPEGTRPEPGFLPDGGGGENYFFGKVNFPLRPAAGNN